jgi:hypothetical protein
MTAAGQFHQISIDEFTLLGDVANLAFLPRTIGMATIVSGSHPQFK